MTTPLDPIPGPPAKSKGDLGTRTLSAIVMVAVAGTALWFGGWVFTAFVVAVGLALIWEWWGLVSRIASGASSLAIWIAVGLFYIGNACYLLPFLLDQYAYGSAPGFDFFQSMAAIIILAVIATDVGAYFAGRSIGGPKIAPQVSPSKTWSGLLGGIVGAWLSIVALKYWNIVQIERGGGGRGDIDWAGAFVFGAFIAVIAQCGDFFESWMKRRAGVKDSGGFIPGHGGLLDRVDGLLAVLVVVGTLVMIGQIRSGIWP